MTEQEWLTSTDPAALLAELRRWDENRRVLRFVEQLPSDRRLLLFCTACCRAVWPLLNDARCKLAVRTAELFADGSCSDSDRASAGIANVGVWAGENRVSMQSRAYARAQAVAWTIGGHCERPLERAWQCQQWLAADLPGEQRADLLRHIVGNPFRPPVIEKWTTIPGEAPERWSDPGKAAKLRIPAKTPSWLTPLIRDLADRAYRTGSAEAALILHDALLDVGQEELAEHFWDRTPCPGCSNGQSEFYGGGGGWCSMCDQSGPAIHYVEKPKWEQQHPKGCWALDLILGKE